METYKIGNKVSGIIRCYTSGTIGSTTMTYDNQPYTSIHGISATLSFTDDEAKASTNFRQLYFNNAALNTVTISDVDLTNKIMNLIFKESDTKLCFGQENVDSDANSDLYLRTKETTLYQVFVYNENGVLESAHNTTTNVIHVAQPNKNYLVIYYYAGAKAYSLVSNENIYLAVDLKIDSNIDDETSEMFIHIDKCGIKIDRSMYFKSTTNTVDLTLQVLDAENSFITVK